MKLEIVIRKNAQGKKLTAAERKLLADYRRKNPAWSKIYESAVASFPKAGLNGSDGRSHLDEGGAAMSRRKSKVVWHYTYQHNIKPILESQVLLPPCMCPGTIHNADVRQYGDTPGGAADAKLLLFSEREDWEPASYRGYRTFFGVIDLLKLEDYAKHDIAVFRIGVETKHLKPYTALCRSVSMPKRMFNCLWKIAVELGSNPYQWWGGTKPIPMSQWVAVEVFANGVWNDCFADDDAPAVGMEATL